MTQTIAMKKTIFLALLIAQPGFAENDALSACRKVEAIEDRVACYDAIVDARQAALQQPTTPQDSAGTPSAQSLFGTSDAEAKRIVQEQLAIEQLEHIESTVADIRQSAGRKLTVVLENGQIWRQLDSSRLLLKQGEAVVIRKASLSSYLLEKQSGSRTIRVKRID